MTSTEPPSKEPHPVALTGLATVVPPTALVQDEVREVFAAQPGLSRLARRIVTASFGASGIERRYTVLEELDRSTEHPGAIFFDPETEELRDPTTKQRNEVYAEHSARLYVEAGRAALAEADIPARDITHVITVSCTGFYAPGPDFVVASELGLTPGVERYHLGFMGCYAAMPALRMARQFCIAAPDAAVLVISVELCTLHLRTSDDPDTIVATSLFGDGAGAGIVTAHPPAGRRSFALDAFATRTTPDGEGDMAWRIGDHGFEMVLSGAVPSIIGENITGALEPLFDEEAPLSAALREERIGDTVPHWAIHPGGRSILDRVEATLGLTTAQLAPARETLRDYGNMSSATVLFVLRNILDSPAAAGERVAAMAFGPGLTVESGLFTLRE